MYFIQVRKSAKGDQEWTTSFPSNFVSYWYTYKLGTPFLTPLTKHEHTVTDSFHFAEEICKQNPNLYMASLDVDSLFTNISLDKTIDICIDSLYNDKENTSKIPKDVFRNLL